MANWSNVLKGIARTVEIAMESKGECAFWNCTKTVRSGYVLCYNHFKGSAAGRVNVCGCCRRYKDARYKQCLNCRERSGNSGSPFEGKNNVTVTAHATRQAKSYEPEYSPAWEAGDKEAPVFFVYVLKLKGGYFYAGQTRELRERLSEHRDGRVRSTAGREPKMVFFTEVTTRGEATELEVELKKAIDKNPRVIRRMITDFQDLTRELDFS